MSLLLILLIGYAVLVAGMYAAQDRLLFYPAEELITSPAQHGLLFETVPLQTADGETLHAWWIPAEPGPARAVLLFFHGNAGNISHRIASAEVFHRLGLDVLLVDYRGYGRSTGTPSEAGLYRDAEAAWRYLTHRRGVDPHRIVVFGRSLGGSVATYLADRHPPGALILENTFTSVPDAAAELYPFLPVRLLIRHRFDTLSRIAAVRAPILILHGRDDQIIPFAHGRRLFEAAGPAATFVALEGGHNDGFLVTGARYRHEIDAFLERHLGR